MPTTFDDLIKTVTSLNRLLAQRLTQKRSKQSHTQLQHGILQFLSSDHGSSVTMIAEQLHLSLPSATQVLGRLERGKLIQRHLDPDDRRRVRFQLTSFGRRHLRSLQQARQREMRRLFSGVTTAQLRQMIVILQKMLNNSRTS